MGKIGKYTKLKAIGKGSFGTVYLVSDPDHPSPLVLKSVSLKGMTAKEQKATHNEVKVLKLLKHPNIIAFEASHVIDGNLCVVMEYASGGDLGEAIAKQAKLGKRFPEEQVRRWLAEIVSAMAHCHHDLHLLHRDLKPANIFIGKGGALKLGDFGISKTLAASKAFAATTCGTPLYMSPELAKGACYDRSADVWAVGCVLYEIMSLAPPWVDKVGNGGISGLMKIINQSSLDLQPLRAHYSSELVALLASLLAKPASARPSLGHVLTTPLIQGALPPPAPPPTSSSTATEPAPTAPGSTAASVASDASSAAAPRFPKGSRVMVKRTSGQESVGVVDKHDPGLNLYSLTLVDKEGKVEGTKRARETDLRAAETALEKQLMELHGRMEDQARRQSGGTPARGSQQPPLKRTPSRGGIAAGADAHAAAAVLQRSFQRRRPVPPPMPAPERLMTPAALLAQQHVRQQRQQQLNRQQQAHRVPPSTAAGRPVESLKEQQRRLAGKGLGQGYYQLKPTPFRPLV